MSILLFLLVLLFWAGSRKNEPDPSGERFISLFIIEYAERTGQVLTREEALRLIKAVWLTHGEELLRATSREDELRRAIMLTERLCAEAERKGRKKH